MLKLTAIILNYNEKCNLPDCINSIKSFVNEILISDLIQMGINGSKFIEENFSWDKIALGFKKQIEKIN